MSLDEVQRRIAELSKALAALLDETSGAPPASLELPADAAEQAAVLAQLRDELAQFEQGMRQDNLKADT